MRFKINRPKSITLRPLYLSPSDFAARWNSYPIRKASRVLTGCICPFCNTPIVPGTLYSDGGDGSRGRAHPECVRKQYIAIKRLSTKRTSFIIRPRKEQPEATPMTGEAP
uniref:Uncharacterized protein n=1 Tax=viral metagenome TaxID=1070528 RepID=A0A6M3IM18_9ZZZZ